MPNFIAKVAYSQGLEVVKKAKNIGEILIRKTTTSFNLFGVILVLIDGIGNFPMSFFFRKLESLFVLLGLGAAFVLTGDREGNRGVIPVDDQP
jgi:hypothetical protein